MRGTLRLSLLVALVAACGQPTAPVTHNPPPPPPPDTMPKLKDPTVLVRNNRPDPAYFSWASGTSTFGADVIPGNATKCEAFSAAVDSAYWQLTTDTTTSGYAMVWSNYFDPTARPAWTADVSGSGNQNPVIVIRDTTTECTP